MRRGIALALATSLAVAVPAGVAVAGNNDVIQEGRCSVSSDWKLKLSPENGRIEVEFEVDQNVVGQTWRAASTRTAIGSSPGAV